MSLKILSKKYTTWPYLFSGAQKSFLIGNVCEAMRLEVDFTYAVEKEYTTASKLILDATNSPGGTGQITLTNADASAWEASGFAVGDTIVISYTRHVSGSAFPTALNATVDNIINDEMRATATVAAAGFNYVWPSSPDVNGDYIDHV